MGRYLSAKFRMLIKSTFIQEGLSVYEVERLTRSMSGSSSSADNLSSYSESYPITNVDSTCSDKEDAFDAIATLQ